MKKIEINLLHLEQKKTSHEFTRPAPATNALSRILTLCTVAAVILSGSAAVSYQQTLSPNSPLNQTFSSFAGVLPQFGENKDRILDGELTDRVNILLLGIGGKGHEGEHLSDTNIVLSIQPKKKKFAFISIPRDLLVPIEGYGWRKINNANAFGETEQQGSGPERASEVVSKILNIPIHYYVRVDFHAFSEVIDILGGVAVDVEHSFTDYSYPTENYKYQSISFTKGLESMDGDRALMFVRSRHSAMNNEGSDFARSKRQQKVLAAVKDKVFSTDFLLDPKKIADVMQSLQENIKTNVSPWQGIRLLTIAKDMSAADMIHLVFDDGPENYLIASTVDGAYVLQPRDGTYEGVQRAVQSIFDDLPPLSDKELIRAEAPRVVIKNGTSIAGLATKVSQQLTALGYHIVFVGNAEIRTLEKTLLYQLSDIKKDKSRSGLEAAFSSALRVSGWDEKELAQVQTQPDFLIILGADVSSIHGVGVE